MSTSLDKLRGLVGMEKIAAQFEQYLLAMRMSRNKGMPCRGHMALMGNPGTGKTTAASLFCKILHEEGLLSKGQFVHVTPFELIGQNIVETETKTKSVCDSAVGGVLCIDDAYVLLARYGDGYGYAREVINVLIGFMTSTEANDTIVMFVGYTDELRHFIDSVLGLKSRVNTCFHFEDFRPEDLYTIFTSKLDGYELSDSFKTKMQQIIQYQYEHRDRTWGNAGTMQNYAEEIIRNHFAKHNGEGVIDVDCIPEHLWIDNVIYNSIRMKNLEEELNLQINEMQAELQNSIRMRKLKAEMNLLVNEIQTKLQQLQSKLDELFEE